MKLINETFDNDLLEIRVSQNLTKLGAGGGGWWWEWGGP